MTPEEYWPAVELFAQLQDMAVEERQAALDAACEGNPALRAQVLRLLDADSHASGGSFLERPAIEDAAQLASVKEVQSPSPGTVLGNYLLGQRIGAGGMGIVYEAQDQRLQRRVALKILPQPFAAEGSERIKRFQQEARAASLLNHPNIVSIFDAGAEQGFYYIAMEFVEGKTVRALIAEGGTSDSRMALDLVAQTAAALSAAHAAGIVHRDIKPENIMVRPDGFVKVLDFGLAKQREGSLPAVSDLHTGAGQVAGTIQYLSPEQVIGKAADGRSDIFSLGVVAYELVTGRRPFDGTTDGAIFDAILHHTPEPPSSVQPQLGIDLDALVLRTLEKDRELRFQTASDLASSCKRLLRDSSSGSATGLPQPPAVKPPAVKKARIWPRRKAAITAAFVATFASVAGYVAWQRFHRPLLSDRDVIVLSDFVNTTGDPVFDGTLKQVLSTELEDSSYLNILSDDRLRRALGFMGKKPSERVTPEIARQICEREDIKAVVTGTISPAGSRYLLTLEAAACANGETLARVEELAQTKEKTLAAVAAAASRLRGRLGDSLARVKAPATRPQQVTTASLEAYKQFALGREVAGDQRKSLPFYQRAIELDPSFATAYAFVAVYYANFGEPMVAREYISKAYSLRDRVSERERLYITAHYFSLGVEDLHQAVDVDQQRAMAYPRDSTVFAGLGTRFEQLGEYEPALDAYRKALELDPRDPLAYANVLTMKVKLNRLEDAKAIAQEAFRNGVETLFLHDRLLQIAYFQEDMEEVRKQEDWLRPRSAEHPGAHRAAEWLSAHGRFRKAEEWLTVAQSALPRDRPAAIARFSSLSAIQDALIGDCRSVRPAVADALARNRDHDLIGAAGVALALCGESAQAAALAAEIQSGWPQSTIANAVDVPGIRAAMALHEGKPEAAVAALQPAAPYARAYPISSYIRGMAYLRMKSGTGAAAEFQKAIDGRLGFIGGPPRNYYCTGRVWAAAYLGLGRAQAIAGNRAEARKAYEKFLDLWKDADPGIPLLAEARKEYAAMTRQP